MTLSIKGSKKLGQRSDETFRWATTINPELEQWRILAEEYLKTIVRAKPANLLNVGRFLKYIHENSMSTNPSEFLQFSYPAVSFYHSQLLGAVNSSEEIRRSLRQTYEFLNWVLYNYFSVEDDNGHKVVPSEYRNPFSPEIPNDAVTKGKRDETDKNILPYKFIKQLRNILCPIDATCFKDWKWAQEAIDTTSGGDWFVVNKATIDKDDPDCVWRQRETTHHEQKSKGLPQIVFELWSPVRSVALYVKLRLPLRTYQVRLLDSGEADTFRYKQDERRIAGRWLLNNNPLKQGSEKSPYKRGVFRQDSDPFTRVMMTGLYINTNKTADIDKDEWAKGYFIPWEETEVLYWSSKLRDWQAKYNPLDSPVSWTSLELKHLGHAKSDILLKQAGSSCFLFRDAAASEDDKKKPITNSSLQIFWPKLLLKLEETERDIRLVKSGTTTFFPLHSLRVSLITCYALEGGVPMPILSRCIAGHSRLIMTLYYTKMGVTYVSEKMDEAERRMAEQEQEEYQRWIKDATSRQLKANTAVNDPAVYQTVLNAQQSGASFIKGDKGICTKGCLGCETGGMVINDDTGKVSYGLVPGFPEQNCVRCRWFLTGPAFLPGLVHHFNVIGYKMSEVSERLNRFQKEVEDLENLRFEAEQFDRPFMKNEQLKKAERLYEQELIQNDKLANDYNATLRLILRSDAIIKEAPNNKEIQFVAVGNIESIKISLDDKPNKLFQIQTICNGAVIYPETDVSKAVLQRSQILDMTLAMNGQRPIFFTLTEEQQLIAGNAWMQLLIAQTNSLEEAIPYAEGIKKLKEIGLEEASMNLIQSSTGFRMLGLPPQEDK